MYNIEQIHYTNGEFMNAKIEKFFKKHDITPDDIKYIIREDGKTSIYIIGGRVVSTYNTIKEIRENLPADEFLYPNKGVVLAASQVVDVGGGEYRMADGRSFKYRIHNSVKHDSRLLMLGRRLEHVQAVADAQSLEALKAKYAIFDNMPLPACVIEVVIENSSMEFVVRYMNRKMEEIQGISADEAIGRPFSDYFHESNHIKWFAIIADVALNNSTRTTTEHSSLLNGDITIYCYQPLEGYCVALMVPPKSDQDME